MEESKLKEIHDFFIDIAKKAGEVIVSAKPSTETAGNKKNCIYAHTCLPYPN
jgi:myo-inositol-1(or 4)-monophosphatase